MASQKQGDNNEEPSGLMTSPRTGGVTPPSQLVFGTLPESFEQPDGLVPVAVFRKQTLANEFGLAVLAMGESYWAFADEADVVLCVKPDSAAAVGRELLAFNKVRRRRRDHTHSLAELPVSWAGPLVYAVLLIAFFFLQQSESGSGITNAGRTDAQAIWGDGEWWRCTTALFLHGDIAHLGANLIAGAGFALLLGRSFGTGATWFGLLLCGTLGNALTAGLYFPEAHLSIGASTAVFAALGLLTGSGCWFALRSQQRGFLLPKWTIPALGGVALLGFLGVGSDTDRIDVLAHLCGFGIGALTGIGFGALQHVLATHHKRINRPLAAIALTWIALAWLVAVRF